MGDVIPFKRKQVLEFPMIINDSGMGINPDLIKRIHVSKTGTLYFALAEDVTETPQCALVTPSYIDACTSAMYLKNLLSKEFDKDVEVHYDEC